MQEIVDHVNGSGPESEIARTLLLPYLNHAATMYESGYATAADIDAAMRFGCGYPVGPLALVDALGAKNVASGLDALYAETGDELHQPTAVLTRHAEEGTTFAEAEGDTAQAEPAFEHTIERVGVVGTGTMACGIVEVFAKAGYDVTFVGRSTEKVDGVVAAITKSLDKAVSRGRLDEDAKSSVLERLTASTERAALADADIVVEAIAEDLAIKLELFADLDRIAKPGAILATTTSSLSINACAAATGRPQDVIGMHFFNPAAVMKLVEVVTADGTSVEVDETVRALCLATGKHPVSCGDRAGFIVNALLFPYLNDAVRLHESGEASMADIDAAMQTAGLPMGPFALLDVVGNDVSLAIQRSLVETFGHAGWQPAPMLEQVVAEGRLGRKSGQGFLSY
jgi:3-hydroxybutyryl-CoA dehydrogenase